MTAFVIYDSFALACRANTLLQSVAANVGNVFDWNISPWRTQILRFEPTARLALADARNAHLLIFAWEKNRSFPSWLQGWLENWAANRTVKDAALAIVSDGASDGSPVSELSQFAVRHGLTLITSEEMPPGFPISAPLLIEHLNRDGALFRPELTAGAAAHP